MGLHSSLIEYALTVFQFYDCTIISQKKKEKLLKHFHNVF